MTATIVRTDPRIGTAVKEFEILRKLGKGGMGAVYLGKHPVLGLAAIKFLDVPNSANYEDLVLRFEDEARALGTLRGTPNIASILDISYDPPALITEYVEGSSFDFCLGEETLWGNAAQLRYLDVLVQIAKALVKVHQEGIIHRDIKPENIMIKDLLAKVLYALLIDFGIARKSTEEGEERRTTFASVMGTLMYAPPEQLIDPLGIGKTVDLYSLGLMAFLILNRGVHLYGSEDHVKAQLKGKGEHDQIEWVKKTVKDEERTQRLLEGIDPRAAKVIWPCLRYKPEDRVQSAEELYEGFLKLHQELSLEQQAKSVATTAAVPILVDDSGADQGDTKKNPYSGTILGVTSPGVVHEPKSEPESDSEPELKRKISAKPATIADVVEPPELATEKEKAKRGRLGAFLIAVICVVVAVAGMMAVYVIQRKVRTPTKPRKAKAETLKPPTEPRASSKAKVKTPKARPVPKKPRPAPIEPRPAPTKALPVPQKPVPPKPPAKGKRPSNAYIAHVYQKMDAKCRRTDPRKEVFDRFPHYHLGCVRWYVQKLRDKDRQHFDRVALAVLILDEARAHFCFYKRRRVCGKGKESKFFTKRQRLINECKKVAYKIGAKRKMKGSKLKRLTDMMNGPQAEKIGIWMLLRQARRKQIQAAWIKSQPSERMLCFKKR